MSAATAPRLWHIVTSSLGELMQCAPLFSKELSGSSVWQPTFLALWDGAECPRGCPGALVQPHTGKQPTSLVLESTWVESSLDQGAEFSQMKPVHYLPERERDQPFAVLRLGRAGVGKRALMACSPGPRGVHMCTHTAGLQATAAPVGRTRQEETRHWNEPEPRRPQAWLRNAPRQRPP